MCHMSPGVALKKKKEEKEWARWRQKQCGGGGEPLAVHRDVSLVGSIERSCVVRSTNGRTNEHHHTPHWRDDIGQMPLQVVTTVVELTVTQDGVGLG